MIRGLRSVIAAVSCSLAAAPVRSNPFRWKTPTMDEEYLATNVHWARLKDDWEPHAVDLDDGPPGYTGSCFMMPAVSAFDLDESPYSLNHFEKVLKQRAICRREQELPSLSEIYSMIDDEYSSIDSYAEDEEPNDFPIRVPNSLPSSFYDLSFDHSAPESRQLDDQDRDSPLYRELFQIISDMNASIPLCVQEDREEALVVQRLLPSSILESNLERLDINCDSNNNLDNVQNSVDDDVDKSSDVIEKTIPFKDVRSFWHSLAESVPPPSDDDRVVEIELPVYDIEESINSQKSVFANYIKELHERHMRWQLTSNETEQVSSPVSIEPPVIVGYTLKESFVDKINEEIANLKNILESYPSLEDYDSFLEGVSCKSSFDNLNEPDLLTASIKAYQMSPETIHETFDDLFEPDLIRESRSVDLIKTSFEVDYKDSLEKNHVSLDYLCEV